jgi:hypothetical protein
VGVESAGMGAIGRVLPPLCKDGDGCSSALLLGGFSGEIDAMGGSRDGGAGLIFGMVMDILL